MELNLCGCYAYVPDDAAGELPLICAIGESSEGVAAIAMLMHNPAVIAGIPVGDWNDDLTPWPAPPLGKGSEFTGHAEDTLAQLNALLPQLTEQVENLGITVGAHIILGYSLGGLFALWAVTRCTCFDGAASISGSLWYDGFDEYISAHAVQARAVYLSLGDAEPLARNRRLAHVGESTLTIADTIKTYSVKSVFEWNRGNHFADPPMRCARGADWLCENIRCRNQKDM